MGLFFGVTRRHPSQAKPFTFSSWLIGLLVYWFIHAQVNIINNYQFKLGAFVSVRINNEQKGGHTIWLNEHVILQTY
jgi:hypothetical protein